VKHFFLSSVKKTIIGLSSGFGLANYRQLISTLKPQYDARRRVVSTAGDDLLCWVSP